MRDKPVAFAFRPQQVIGPLAAITAGLVALHFVSTALVYGRGWPASGNLHVLVDLNHERNLPSYFAGMMHLLLAIATGLVGLVERRHASAAARCWFSWSAVFAFFSLDEIISIHERISNPVQQFLGTSGVLAYAWVIPYLVLAVAVAIGSIKVLIVLPNVVRNRLIIGGAVFVVGAAGLEIVGLALFGRRNHDNLGYAMVTTLEEVMELSGLLIFLAGVLERLRWWIEQAPIAITAAKTSEFALYQTSLNTGVAAVRTRAFSA